MRLTNIDRMERIEEILQEKIRNTEEQMASIEHIKDAVMARLRIMYLMDLGQMRQQLIELRRRIDLEYAISGRKRNDETGRDDEGAGMGAEYEADCEYRMPEPGTGARAGGCIPHVGRDGWDIPGNHEGYSFRERRRVMNGNGSEGQLY